MLVSHLNFKHLLSYSSSLILILLDICGTVYCVHGGHHHVHLDLTPTLYTGQTPGPNTTENDQHPGWIKSCGNSIDGKNSLNFQATQCPSNNKGLWISYPVEPGCVCVNGLWILSTDLCDDDMMIVYGDGHCFKLQKKIQKVSYLGSAHDPFSSKTFVGWNRGQFIFEPMQDGKLLTVNDTFAVLRINPESSLYYKLYSTKPVPVCMDEVVEGPTHSDVIDKDTGYGSSMKRSGLKQHSLLLTKVTPPVAPLEDDVDTTETQIALGESKDSRICSLKNDWAPGYDRRNHPTWFNTYLTIGQGFMFKSEKIIKPSRKCESVCLKENGKGLHRHEKSHFSKESKTALSSKSNSLKKSNSHLKLKRRVKRAGAGDLKQGWGEEAKPQGLALDGFFGMDTNKKEETASAESRNKLVTEQNLRIIKLETNFMQSLDPGPTFNDSSYELLQISRQITSRVCKRKLLPKALLKSIARLFRYILIETQDRNAYGSAGVDPVRGARILSTLQTCLNNSNEWTGLLTNVATNCHDDDRIVTTTTPKPAPPKAAAAGAAPPTDCLTAKPPPDTCPADCKTADPAAAPVDATKCQAAMDEAKKTFDAATPPPAPTTGAPPTTESPGPGNPTLLDCESGNWTGTTPACPTECPKGDGDPPKYDDVKKKACETVLLALPPPGPKKTEVCECSKKIIGIQLNETRNSSCTNLTNSLAWNYPSRDLVVETVWKVFEFSHYYCAPYFHADGTDVSVFHERIERLFHSDILYRWHNPGTESTRTWEYFYFAYNLKNFVDAMDACVCAAQSISPYVPFMSRPLTPIYRKKREAPTQIKYNGPDEHQKNEKQAQIPLLEPHLTCLDDEWDPISKLNARQQSSCERKKG